MTYFFETFQVLTDSILPVIIAALLIRVAFDSVLGR